jgi:hypothetical protein
MPSTTPKYRRPLNKSQIELLLLLYRFRFITEKLLAQYMGKKSTSVINTKLKVLMDQKYIGRKYDNNSRINRQPAVYYLMPEAIRLLKRKPECHSKILKTIYNDHKASDQFIREHLLTFNAYNRLTVTYGENLKYFTASELKQYDYLSKLLPNGFMILSSEGNDKRFFLEVFVANRDIFYIRRILRKYIEYAESGKWEQNTHSDMPVALLVCETERAQKRLRRQAVSITDNQGTREPVFAIATIADLNNMADDKTIWQRTGNPSIKLPLESLN